MLLLTGTGSSSVAFFECRLVIFPGRVKGFKVLFIGAFLGTGSGRGSTPFLVVSFFADGFGAFFTLAVFLATWGAFFKLLATATALLLGFFISSISSTTMMVEEVGVFSFTFGFGAKGREKKMT